MIKNTNVILGIVVSVLVVTLGIEGFVNGDDNTMDVSGRVVMHLSIRDTLKRTKQATWAVLLPHPDQTKKGFPTAVGTGFFVSSDGWFVTAGHVIREDGKTDGPVRNDISKARLEKDPALFGDEFCGRPQLQAVSFKYADTQTDFALLKVDFEANKNKLCFKGKTGFPYIEVSSRELDEGEDIYSFGYPLPQYFIKHVKEGKADLMVGSISLFPRVTSAIISSTLDEAGMVWSSQMPKVYVLDKALNYGNSGGPIVATETGKVHAFCSRFQPLFVPQKHLLMCDN